MKIFGFARNGADAPVKLRRHTPWISSPLQKQEASDNTEPPNGHPPSEKDSHYLLFKTHNESTTIELFYDLFFVANMGTLTSNHKIVNEQTLKNYIGFFTLLWATWLQTSLFDVRFASTSVFDRVCKFISFGVMTGFAITGAIYDTTDVAGNLMAFRAVSIILMVSRLSLVIQYGVVSWFVRGHSKAVIPLLSTMVTLFAASMIFLGTFFGFSIHLTEADSQGPEATSHTYIAWYITVCAEAALVIGIACIWRVVSFKRTHLVKRVGLLTLIIIGEGVIGMSKSVSTVIQKTQEINATDICVILSSVLVLYFIWVLYFDQIEHDRFGTIRQQIWAILHFPLHVTILLSAEGITALILWNSIVRALLRWNSAYPLNNDGTLGIPVTSTEQLLKYIEHQIEELNRMLHYPALENSYNYEQNLTAIETSPLPFRSPGWLNDTGVTIAELWAGVQTAIFEHYGVQSGEASADDVLVNLDAKLTAIQDLWDTVFAYFYIAAGAFLIVLAILYWFGNKNKDRGEWISILVRILFGVGIGTFCLLSLAPDSPAQEGFMASSWPVPVVAIAFFVVIVLDNLVIWKTNKTKVNQNFHEKPSMLEPKLTIRPMEAKAQAQVMGQGSENNQLRLPVPPRPTRGNHERLFSVDLNN